MAEPIFKLREVASGRPYLILPGDNTAGRNEDAAIRLADDSISRRHAVFHNREDGLWVEDLASTNGTFVEGYRIGNPVKLRLGDVVRLGEVDFRIDPEVGPAGAAVQPELPPPTIPWETFQRKTDKIPAADVAEVRRAVAGAVPAAPVAKTVPARSGAFPGGSLFSQPETPPPVAPVPAPVAGTLPPLRPGRRLFWFFIGLLLGLIGGLLLARWLFLHG